MAYSEDSGGITYVPPPNYVPPPPSMRDTEFAAEAGMLHPNKERSVRGSGPEMEHWVPSDAYALANDFRRQHMAQMPMEIFAELLLRLNQEAINRMTPIQWRSLAHLLSTLISKDADSADVCDVQRPVSRTDL